MKTFRISNHLLKGKNSKNSNDLFRTYKNSSEISKPVIVKLNRNGHLVELEVDTWGFFKSY